jgi:hypothetical protein
MSSAYHPQTDGQTERVNQCLETFLRCFVHACPKKWYRWLALAEFWYNTAHHSALGSSPFEVLYGHPPRHFGVLDISVAVVPDLAEWLKERAMVTALLHRHLLCAQQRMEFQADKKRSDREFVPGDWVFLKAQPYAQSSLAARSNHKLAFRYFGPFQVEAKVGAVAYRLKLPADCAIHPVIHVSQLRQASPPDSASSVSLPPTVEQSSPLPMQILARRLYQLGAAARPQVKVRWTGQGVEEATWEAGRMRTLFVFGFLLHRLGGKPLLNGGENVTIVLVKSDNLMKVNRRPVREKWPNVRLFGPEWAKN